MLINQFKLEIIEKTGYTNNILKTFTTSPFGYFKYFEEILLKSFKKVSFKKRLYVIKHYILFAVLTNRSLKQILQNIKGITNKIIIAFLYLPGKLKTKQKFLNKRV